MIDKIVTSLALIGIVIIISLLASSCATVDQQLDETVFYKRDMDINVNGHVGVGAIVIPASGQYLVSGKARGILDLFTLTTCHRELTREYSGYDFSEKIIPVRGIEDAGACSIQLGGYEKKRGRHSWGFIDIQDSSATLPALLKCNGQVTHTDGVSVCQSRAELIQAIEFDEPTVVALDQDCLMPPVEADGKTYIFELMKKECVYTFKGKVSGKFHRLTTLGYEKILLREE